MDGYAFCGSLSPGMNFCARFPVAKKRRKLLATVGGRQIVGIYAMSAAKPLFHMENEPDSRAQRRKLHNRRANGSTVISKLCQIATADDNNDDLFLPQ